jgi:hypothetical protein
MAKAYWIATYFSVSNPDALAEYAKLACRRLQPRAESF